MVEWKKLGDLCSKITDGSHYSPKSVEEGYFMPSVKDMTTNGFDYTLCKKISEDDYLSLIKSGCKPKINDVLVAKDGSMLKYVFPISKEENIVVLSSIAILTPKTNIINSRYLSYYLLKSDVKKQTIREYSSKGGVPRIILKNFRKIGIPVPSLHEQIRIIGILDTFTASIENLKEQIAQRRKQYECYRDQLLDLEGKTIKETLSFGDDFLLKARIGWQGLTKKEYRSNGDYKLVTGTDFTKNLRINFDSCVYVDKERYEQDDYIKLKVGDVLITKDGTLGKVAYIDALDIPATLNGGVFVVRDLENRVIPKFTMYYLTSNHFKKWMQQNHTSGSIQHLTQKLLSSFTIPVFSIEEQSRIVTILDTFEASIRNLEAQQMQRQKQYEYYREKLLTFE